MRPGVRQKRSQIDSLLPSSFHPPSIWNAAVAAPHKLDVQVLDGVIEAEYGDWTGGDSTKDLRRVVELAPAEPLPSNCAATLNLPERVDSVTTNRTWAFHTYGPLAVDTVECGYNTGRCPIGPAHIYFHTPVRGSEVLRHVHLAPAMKFAVSDTTAESADWSLDAQLAPLSRYLVTVDSGLTDVFGQRLAASYSKSVATTSYTPQVRYPYGRMLVERTGPRTLAVEHVNADTLVVTIVGVPDSLEQRILQRVAASGRQRYRGHRSQHVVGRRTFDGQGACEDVASAERESVIASHDLRPAAVGHDRGDALLAIRIGDVIASRLVGHRRRPQTGAL